MRERFRASETSPATLKFDYLNQKRLKKAFQNHRNEFRTVFQVAGAVSSTRNRPRGEKNLKSITFYRW